MQLRNMATFYERHLHKSTTVPIQKLDGGLVWSRHCDVWSGMSSWRLAPLPGEQETTGKIGAAMCVQFQNWCDTCDDVAASYQLGDL